VAAAGPPTSAPVPAKPAGPPSALDAIPDPATREQCLGFVVQLKAGKPAKAISMVMKGVLGPSSPWRAKVFAEAGVPDPEGSGTSATAPAASTPAVAVADKPKEKKKKATAAAATAAVAAPPPPVALSAPPPSTALVVKEPAPSVAIDVDDDGVKKKKKKKKEADERRTRFTSLETLETGDEAPAANISPIIIGLIMFTGVFVVGVVVRVAVLVVAFLCMSNTRGSRVGIPQSVIYFLLRLPIWSCWIVRVP